MPNVLKYILLILREDIVNIVIKCRAQLLIHLLTKGVKGGSKEKAAWLPDTWLRAASKKEIIC